MISLSIIGLLQAYMLARIDALDGRMDAMKADIMGAKVRIEWLVARADRRRKEDTEAK